MRPVGPSGKEYIENKLESGCGSMRGNKVACADEVCLKCPCRVVINRSRDRGCIRINVL